MERSPFPKTPQELRRHHREVRDAMTKKQAADAARSICAQLGAAEWYRETLWIYGYYPLGREADCLAFLERALSDGKRVALPRVKTLCREDTDCWMDFYEVTSLTQVERGSFGVAEPLADCRSADAPDAVVLVPGVVFGLDGNRYGYGKGFYDRYFARFPQYYRVGIAYEHQLEKTLLAKETDVRMDCIYTERQRYLPPERNREAYGITGDL